MGHDTPPRCTAPCPVRCSRGPSGSPCVMTRRQAGIGDEVDLPGSDNFLAEDPAVDSISVRLERRLLIQSENVGLLRHVEVVVVGGEEDRDRAVERRVEVQLPGGRVFLLSNLSRDIAARTLPSVLNSPPVDRPRHASSVPSAWFGILAYPKISGSRQSWEWVIRFAHSLSPNSQKVRLRQTTSAHILPVVNSIQFPGVKSVFLEGIYLRGHVDLNSWITTAKIVPRYDCGYPQCTERKTKLLLREPVTLDVRGHVAVLHGLLTDVYDLQRVIAALSSRTEILITAVTVLPAQVKEKEENYAIKLHDFLHGLYFIHNWIPVSATLKNCTNHAIRSRHGCLLWITWTAWTTNQPLRYIPPAGDGTPEMELQRLSTFINHQPVHVCQTVQKFGGSTKSSGFIDGQYAVCLDQLRPAIHSNSCLVYSFGISDDWSFDDEMHEFGCEVHSFDPSIGIPSQKRNRQHWFHNLGLTTSDASIEPNWTVASYSDIQRNLRHKNRMVSVLKMDVEGAEWAFLRDSMTDVRSLNHVEQFIVEIHPVARFGTWRDIIRQRSLMLHYLEKRGFVLFNSRQNVIGLDLRSLDYTQRLGKDTGNFLYELSFTKPKNSVK
ncbi:hypothetical protein BV898_17097 [Hypsibius exemplaris]|uniref:Methyltransferase domain-containing protein n=1 Tax=Hypsibius exemplaris TaxID=2072580 RepID=A0A9X6NEG8_HYPEX|nr:hypothetical protein BV898_17097 [Hypsibius exemplaris]